MARIAGINLPNNKRIEVALTYIYGVGRSLSKTILSQTNIDFNKKILQLKEEEINRLRNLVEKSYKIEGDLRREVIGNIKRMKEIKAYRGIRHERHLPARGQGTKNNSRTVRGNVRRTALSGKKPTAQKT